MTLVHGSVKNGTQRVRSVPLFKGPIWEGANKDFSDNKFSKRKALDEGSL